MFVLFSSFRHKIENWSAVEEAPAREEKGLTVEIDKSNVQ